MILLTLSSIPKSALSNTSYSSTSTTICTLTKELRSNSNYSQSFQKSATGSFDIWILCNKSVGRFAIKDTYATWVRTLRKPSEKLQINLRLKRMLQNTSTLSWDYSFLITSQILLLSSRTGSNKWSQIQTLSFSLAETQQNIQTNSRSAITTFRTICSESRKRRARKYLASRRNNLISHRR